MRAVNCGRSTRLPPSRATIPSYSSLDDWQLQVPEFLGIPAHEFLTLVNNVATFTYTTIGFTLASVFSNRIRLHMQGCRYSSYIVYALDQVYSSGNCITGFLIKPSESSSEGTIDACEHY